MEYKNAEDILPTDLLEMVQKYAKGEHIYIPIPTEEKKKWGEVNGIKQKYTERNNLIRSQYKNNESLDDLSKCHGLAIETLKKIIYSKE